ncbi:hypothetical protein A1332_15255 [Methylomonas methanica]|uniref:PNPLA domain-containing protein n=2 Tax=Methylomonas methanica TaxID=421 RepID=A0A177MFM6_METMH|nr:hypothetical protein A1332_15255 [Methylomonas methanica]
MGNSEIPKTDRQLLENASNHLKYSQKSGLSRQKIWENSINDKPSSIYDERFNNFNNTEKVTNNINISNNSFENLDGLCTRESTLMVALSGGGARAAVLASHALALLEEKYNQNRIIDKNHNGDLDFVDQISVFSTVSGGSIYAYQVGRIKTLLEKVLEQLKERKNDPEYKDQELVKYEKILLDYKRNFFQNIDSASTYSLENIKNHGTAALAWYLSPGNFFIGPALTFLTNYNYAHVLSFSADIITGQKEIELLSYETNKGDFFYNPDSKIEFDKFLKYLTYRSLGITFGINKLSDITSRPIFLFNATDLSSGAPFVFTQRYIHIPFPQKFNQTARLDLYNFNRDPQEVIARPLRAATLEDINSSPASMPSAVAAMASAAFPLGIEPVELIKFGYEPVHKDIFPTADRLRVSDGGEYDNSGLSSLVDLIDYIRIAKTNNTCAVKKLALLSINADADGYDNFYPYREAAPESWTQKVPVDLGLPIRVHALGVDALNFIHFKNKRRAEEIALNNIKEDIVRYDSNNRTCNHKSKESDIDVYYFPISLQQLSAFDSYSIEDKSNIYERLKNIPTNYQISEDDSIELARAASKIITADQKHGWCDSQNSIGEKKEISRLDDALFNVLF